MQLSVYDSDGRKVAEVDDLTLAAWIMARYGEGSTIRVKMRLPGRTGGLPIFKLNDPDLTFDDCDLERIVSSCRETIARIKAGGLRAHLAEIDRGGS